MGTSCQAHPNGGSKVIDMGVLNFKIKNDVHIECTSSGWLFFNLYFSLYIFLLRRNSRRLLRASTTSTDKNETTRMDAMVSMSTSFSMSPILQHNFHNGLKNQLTS